MKLLRHIVHANKYYFAHQPKATSIQGGAHSSTISTVSKTGGNFYFQDKPNFVTVRNQMFSRIKDKIEKVYGLLEKPDITIKLKNGKEVQGHAFVTTPLHIAKAISKSLAEGSLVAKIKYTKKYDSPFSKAISSAEAEDQMQANHEYELFDLNRPLQGDCEMELVSFDDKEGKQVFWHSSAHLLGQSLEQIYGAWLCHGPPLENGFFYDSYTGNQTISQNDYQKIEKQIKNYSQQKQVFERIVLSKDEALEMFKYNAFKCQLIQSKVPEGGLTSAYRCGNLIDLCTGPHLPSAGLVKGFKVTKNSSSYWLGKKENDNLQRVYAVSFPKQSLLEQYVQAQEELSKRDHRNIGPKQNLFHFTNLSPGSALFYPHGTIIYSRLQDLMRGQYKIRGYSEVISPNIYSSELWKTSGHYFKYKENIFWIKNENEEYGLKPMNCPGHCVMFAMNQKSYKDLPIRMADFGALHRNELTGALSGLTRVRRFQQDDAHIFCTPDQIEEQILAVLDLLDYIYSVFGFKYVLQLSTRPEQFLGDIEEWNQAESQLKEALKKFGKQYKLNHGDGAFYGPKIDVKLFDVFGREHQCGTVQLDFQLPQRFNLQFRGGKNNAQQNKNREQKDEDLTQAKKGEKAEISEEERQRLKEEKLRRKQELQKNKQEEKFKTEGEQHANESMSQQQKYSKIQPVKNGFERPVMIHRAIFGSLERFIAILCEHNGGKWDFWISPRQLKLIPLSKEQVEFAEQLKNTLILKGYSVEVDLSNDKLDKKIRTAQLQSFNYIGVIGKKQTQQNSITLRKRDQQQPFGTLPIAQMMKLFEEQSQPAKSRRRLELEENSFKY